MYTYQSHHFRLGTWLLFMALMAAPVSLVAQSIYKWTDEEGQVHYSQTPPSQGESEEVDAHARTSTGIPAGIEGISEANRKRDEERAAQEELKKREGSATKAEIEAEQAAYRKEVCDAARARLKIWETNPNPRTPYQQEDGSTVRYTSDEMAAKRAEDERKVQENCY